MKVTGINFLALILLALLTASGEAISAEQQVQSSQDSWGYSKQESSADWGEEWGEEWDATEAASPWQLNGLIEAGFGQFIQDNITPKQQSLSELRGQFEASYTGKQLTFVSKTDLLIDDVTEEIDLEARELSIAFNASDNTNVSVGRQIITWGTGDYLFLNDLFAKDWQSFFSGREDVYLKAPNDALRVLHYFDKFTVDFVYSPEFTADNYINGERFSFYSPLMQKIVAPKQFPVANTDHEQYAMRIASTVNGVEYAAYAYKGFWTTPVGMKNAGIDAGKAYFPKLNTYGASIRMPVFSGLFNAEAAVYNSVEDASGSNPLVANGQVRLLLGYEQELATNFTGAFQAYLEHTKDYSALKAGVLNPATLVDQNRQVYTARLTHLSMRQKLRASLFIFYSPTDKDAYLKPSINYRYSDQWQFSGGGNVFIGDNNYSFFGQHQDNSNLWLRVRYSY